MADGIARLMAQLDGAAAALRARGAAVLPPESMARVERRAVEVAQAVLGGEPLPVDGTDELLSVESEVPQHEQRPAGAGLGEVSPDADTLGAGDPLPSAGEEIGVGVAAAGAAAVGAAVMGSSLGNGEEDVHDDATVVDQAPEALSWEDAQTFVAEEDSEVPLEFIEPTVTSELHDDEPAYVVEENTPLLSDLEEDGGDDPSDAGLVSFNHDDTASYITYDEAPGESEIEPEPAPAPPPDTTNYVSYDEVPVGTVSDADLALGTESVQDEDEEVTLGNIPRPVLSARLGEEEEAGDGPSFSDVGEDALVTIEEDGDDLLGDLDESEGVETFDLIPDATDEVGGEDDEEITLVSGLDEPEAEIEEVEIDSEGDLDEIMVDDSRGAGVHASAGPPRAAPTPQVSVAGARVTAGLYGNPSVPTIREGNDPVPKAAAVQLNASGGGGRMLGLEEEEEPIELGSVGDYGEDEEEYEGDGDGLSIAIQEYDYEEEEEEEEELELEPEPAAPPPPRGPTPEEIQAIFDRAQAAANSGALEEAADLFSDVVDADPDHLEAHVGRGRLYLDLGDYSRAMSDFMVAEEIDENSPEPQVAIGDLYFHRKDYRKAIEYFDTALKMSPNHAMAFCRRGISHYYRKNYKEALSDLEKANAIDPDIPNIASFISMAKRKAKRK